MDTILVVNAGSSSVKFQLFATKGAGDLERLVKGQMDGIGVRARLRASSADGKPLTDQSYSVQEIPDLPAAMLKVGAWLRETQDVNLVAVGHRVVHGGPDYDRPVIVDDKVLAQLERYIPLAPLHQPNNLAPIRSIRGNNPQLPQVACFDTAFHRGHSALADYYAIPERLHAEGVRRYGFHGLSYEFIANRLPQVAPKIAGGRVIVAHLGSGASMCALSAGRSIESTMGFTALDGLPMGTRPGQLDPGVILYLVAQKGMSAAAVEKLLYHECGLKALSGISNDVRELLASDHPQAAAALEYFVYRAIREIGSLTAALGGLDALIFTAGIGENSPAIRARICAGLGWLGIGIEPEANARGRGRLSPPQRAPSVWVIPTDEESVIAAGTLAVVSAATVSGRRAG